MKFVDKIQDKILSKRIKSIDVEKTLSMYLKEEIAKITPTGRSYTEHIMRGIKVTIETIKIEI